MYVLGPYKVTAYAARAPPNLHHWEESRGLIQPSR